MNENSLRLIGAVRQWQRKTPYIWRSLARERNYNLTEEQNRIYLKRVQSTLSSSYIILQI